MCKVLQIPRSTYYYEAKERVTEDDMTSDVIDIFHASRQNYGTRKIKIELKKRGLIVSRRRIGRIMQEQGLVSTYTLAKFKPHTKSCNESEQKNRAFGPGGRNGGGCKRFDIRKSQSKMALHMC